MVRTLLIDLETSPILGYTWDVYETNVLSVLEPIKVLSCAWKWIDQEVIYVKGLCDFKDYKGGTVDDKELVTEVWKLLDEADIVIAHNGLAFDCKVLNTRFIANGLNAPSDYKTIDTLKVARKYFKFGSNKLDGLGIYLEEGRKGSAGGIDTWLKCMKGDAKAWEKMKKYNAQDILLLERIYLRLRPYMKDHPNLNTIDSNNEISCTVCQSNRITKRGFLTTKAGRYQRYACNDCGSWSSGAYERTNRKEYNAL